MKIIEVDSQEELEKKQVEISAKIEAYKAAQAYQLQYGGPGPVADYDIMSIVNCHNGEFQLIVKELEVQEEVQEEIQE